jgi:hypothetical protein
MSAGEFPKLLTIDWTDPDGTSHTFRTRLDRPLTDRDREVIATALEKSGMNAAIDDYATRHGLSREVAERKLVAWAAGELARRSVDEAAYERECARRGVLAL